MQFLLTLKGLKSYQRPILKLLLGDWLRLDHISLCGLCQTVTSESACTGFVCLRSSPAYGMLDSNWPPNKTESCKTGNNMMINPASTQYRPASETPFKLCFAGGMMVARFWLVNLYPSIHNRYFGWQIVASFLMMNSNIVCFSSAGVL